MKYFLFIIMMVFYAGSVAAEEYQVVFQKDIQVKDGVAKIHVIFLPEYNKYKFSVGQETSNFRQIAVSVTIKQEAEVLDEAIQYMLSKGMDIHRLNNSNREVHEWEVMQKLAVAAYSNARWLQHRKTGFPVSNDVLTELLNSTGVYDDFNPVLAKYGMKIGEICGVEKVLAEKYSALGIPFPKGKKKDIYVPVSASFTIPIIGLDQQMDCR